MRKYTISTQIQVKSKKKVMKSADDQFPRKLKSKKKGHHVRGCPIFHANSSEMSNVTRKSRWSSKKKSSRPQKNENWWTKWSTKNWKKWEWTAWKYLLNSCKYCEIFRMIYPRFERSSPDYKAKNLTICIPGFYSVVYLDQFHHNIQGDCWTFIEEWSQSSNDSRYSTVHCWRIFLAKPAQNAIADLNQ